jgi:hypothetical protein
MIARLIIFGVIALIGIVCFITAVIFLTKGHNAEWVTLFLAPISGICLAIVMHFSNIDLKVNLRLLIKDGRVSFKIAQA